LPPYPEGGPTTERYVIDSYGTIGNGAKPPFTTIVKYDLNEPAIKWRVGFGDDPTLVPRGVTGTGVTQMRNSIIVTESGLVLGAGRDNQIRAWDSETGRLLWSSRFGGNFTGSPAMYEMEGRQYLLVPAASTAGGRGGGAGAAGAGAAAGAAGAAGAAPPAGGRAGAAAAGPQGASAASAPLGWVAYALP
jgi:quinoprotein glucose dehydrogenase